ncbi:MAG TPA: hypothetical protein PK325_03435 [Cyclobacteriaceae bacterium]|nr:hypothetical protein [Cyclobacteriaceae bacterium]HMV07866.1 hypothetical protein [Cyclobacteriaceae bacterium]HMV88134.1 hypothetical protein [Cyclobacteriaceae bacterium]HMW99000.1 hypothetical protein [Cyclobacteriaceae bacterium]HMX48366.1 hypothetical protein [Cyclobacteriaceae bacterium]
MENKLLLTSLLMLTCLVAFGQETDRKKPEAKNFTAEVNLNPFSSSPININYLRFRYFTSETSAVRIGFSVSAHKQTPEEDVTRKTFEFNIRPGYEWHLAGTERLSPYFGVEADLAIKTSSFEDQDVDADTKKISGAWTATGVERGFTRIGLNAIIGADFYVTKRVYLGTEFGFGFQSTNFSDIEATYSSDYEKIRGGSDLQVGPNFNSSIRLGFVF